MLDMYFDNLKFQAGSVCHGVLLTEVLQFFLTGK